MRNAAPEAPGPPGPPGVPLRILLAGDQPAFLEGLRHFLEGDEFSVVGEAHAGWEALRATERLRPGLVLLDTRLPDMPGLEVLEMLRRTRPEILVLLVSRSDGARVRSRAAGLGACGLLSRSATRETILEAVRRILWRETLDPGKWFLPRPRPRKTRPLRPSPGRPLTPKEEEVLRLFVRGLTAAEVARRLRCAASTVRTHIKTAYRKIGVTTKAAAVLWAARHHLLDLRVGTPGLTPSEPEARMDP